MPQCKQCQIKAFVVSNNGLCAPCFLTAAYEPPYTAPLQPGTFEVTIELIAALIVLGWLLFFAVWWMLGGRP